MNIDKKTSLFLETYRSIKVAGPKYKALRMALEKSITDGLWVPGSLLPTETQLADLLPISVGTIQQALRSLADDGFIRRRQGRGSIVCDLDEPLAEPWHMRFFLRNSGKENFLPIYTKVLSRKELVAHGPWALALESGAKKFIRIDRIFLINNDLRVFARFYAAKYDFPDLATKPLKELDDKNFKIVIFRMYRKPVHKVSQSLLFETTSKLIAQHSDCEEGQIVSVLRVVTFTDANKPLYYQEFYIPPNKLELNLGISLRGISN